VPSEAGGTNPQGRFSKAIFIARENRSPVPHVPITGAIFDCDGTLLDSMDSWLEAQDELIHQAGFVMTEEETRHVGPLSLPETAAFFHDRFGLGASAEDVIDMIFERMQVQYGEKVLPRPGALAFVRKLHESGIKCSVASSTSPHLLTFALEKTGFLPYLDAVVSVDDVGASKYQPAVYDRARELMGTQKESTWVFEDSLSALKTAKDAGYRTVGVYDRDISGTKAELAIADIVIESFEDAGSLFLP